ncbi:MAG: PEGA domain-containing protein [bacterium]|nr:PEGA domain-containing protein [bacterium]
MPKEFDKEKNKESEELKETEEFGKYDYLEEKALDSDGQLLEVITPPPLPSVWSRLPVLILLSIVVLFVIWSVITKLLTMERYTSLAIISSPAGGLVYLDDEEKGVTPLYLPKIKVKKYNVKVVRGGFKQWDSLIKLESKKTLELKVDLEDITPPKITSYPPSEASIGKDLRIETNVKDNFQVGTVELFYRKKNEKTYTYNCLKMIDSGDDVYWAVIPGSFIGSAGVEYYIKATDGVNETTYPENPLTPQLIIASVGVEKVDVENLSVSSSPSEAEIYIDEELQKSRTPIENMRITAGKHKIRVVKDGYPTWSESVLVKRGEKKRISIILKRSLSSIFVDSSNREANVFVDKKSYGTTPVRISDLVPGNAYAVTVEHDGTIVWNSTITLKAGEEKNIFVKIASKYGRAYITSLPPGAKIYMGDEFIGVTPLRDIKMPVGTHILKAVKEKGSEKTKSITIIEDKISFLNFALEDREKTIE